MQRHDCPLNTTKQHSCLRDNITTSLPSEPNDAEYVCLRKGCCYDRWGVNTSCVLPGIKCNVIRLVSNAIWGCVVYTSFTCNIKWNLAITTKLIIACSPTSHQLYILTHFTLHLNLVTFSPRKHLTLRYKTKQANRNKLLWRW